MDFTIEGEGRTVVEAGTRALPVRDTVDVLVVGGGPAGVAAAVAASRQGAQVMLVERYPYLGGMATGGLVLLFIEYDRYAYGIMKETAHRLQQLEGLVFPPKTSSGSAGEERPRQWVEGQGLVGALSVPFDPELLKYVSNEMVMDARVKPLLNNLCVDVIVKHQQVQGVILENKEGRQAVLANVTVDATGDGDVFALAKAPFAADIHPWGTSLSFRLANVDVEAATQFQRDGATAAEYRRLMAELSVIVEARMVWFPTTAKGVVLFFAWNRSRDALKVADLTATEIEGRKKLMATVAFVRTKIRGFEAAYLQDSAPQVGTRESRRVVGEYVLTKQDVLEGRRFPDVIAKNLFDIPYRCLLPRTIDQLLVAGRCISTTHEAQAAIRMICPCYATGEAAGTAAALASERGVAPRQIDVHELQHRLMTQGVPL